MRTRQHMRHWFQACKKQYAQLLFVTLFVALICFFFQVDIVSWKLLDSLECLEHVAEHSQKVCEFFFFFEKCAHLEK